ncbi:hypothetical protein E2542_SST22578 [Spatholobus suberectus]|nr:hypothetical protein E2542_SST22578 [Spatholobus suberectus]
MVEGVSQRLDRRIKFWVRPFIPAKIQRGRRTLITHSFSILHEKNSAKNFPFISRKPSAKNALERMDEASCSEKMSLQQVESISARKRYTNFLNAFVSPFQPCGVQRFFSFLIGRAGPGLY